MCVLVSESCPTLCNPIDRSPPGPSDRGILQERTPEWVASSFSKRNYRKKEKKKESEVAQSCPTLCDPMDCSLPGSSVHGIFQAIVLEWIAIFCSRGSSWPRYQTQVSCIADRCFTLWATREDTYITPNQGIEHTSPMFLALAGVFFTTGATWQARELLFCDNLLRKFTDWCLHSF